MGITHLCENAHFTYKIFNIPVSIALATLAHMINVYVICLNTTNYPLFNIQHFRYCLWTSILDCFGQLVSPPCISSCRVPLLVNAMILHCLVSFQWKVLCVSCLYCLIDIWFVIRRLNKYILYAKGFSKGKHVTQSVKWKEMYKWKVDMKNQGYEPEQYIVRQLYTFLFCLYLN